VRADQVDPNLFAGSFRSLWKSDASVPALILNTTEVNRGRRELVAPFRINLRLAPQTLAHLGSVIDLRLSSAVVASARFPWVTPAATLSSSDGVIQLADGGYFENSATETAHNLISALTTSEDIAQPVGPISTSVRLNDEDVRIEFRLIVIRARISPDPASINGDLLAPINALMNARQERGVLSFRTAFFDLCQKCSPQALQIEDNVLVGLLDMRDFAYPLGWYLTPGSQERIFMDLGKSQQCPLHDFDSVSRAQIRDNNDCLFLAAFEYLKTPSHNQLVPP
jgi:hypothetical protein